jgi:hypothetical protein
MKWRIKNTSKISWPPNVQLDLVYSHPQILMKSPPVNYTLKAGESQEIEVNAFIPEENIHTTGHLVMIFRFSNKQFYIGQPIIAFLRL